VSDVELTISCRINEVDWQGTVRPTEVVLDFLRDRLTMTGTKRGCEWMVCGACTVLVDGLPTYACNMLAADLDGVELRTVEGLASSPEATGRLLQDAFARHVGLQCGFCTPGQLMSATALVEDNDTLTREQIVEAMRANLCRCGSYAGILTAIEDVHDNMPPRTGDS
jgi:aerobic-type carbon monoxide dehydrogenase small subunit (CoxS/CutS family)